MDSTIEIEPVRAFVLVVRSGGYSAAGRALGVPRSTLSRQVQRLEAALGARLLERTTRVIALTEAGAGYYERCAHALGLIEAANTSVRDAAAQPRGTLRVAAPLDIARELVAPMLPDFRRRYPDLEITVESAQRRADLVAESFDLALRGGERLDDSSLVARRLGSHLFGLFASAGYLALHGVPNAPADLAQHDLIAFAPQRQAIPWRLSGPDGDVGVEPRAWLRANDMGFLQASVAGGAGIGLGELQSAARDSRLRRVLPEYTMHGGVLYAVYPSARRVPAKVRVFVSELRAFVRREGLLGA